MGLNWWNVTILGVVQGITELLPISSDGHLAFAQLVLGLDAVPLTFDIMLHGGTLLAIMWYFRKDILALDWKGWQQLAIATIPVAVIGLAARDAIEPLKHYPVVVALGFWTSALFLFFSQALLQANDRFDQRFPWLATLSILVASLPRSLQKVLRQQPSWLQVFGVGLLQTLAILPGVSRSGSALTGSLLVGFDKQTAFRFAFLVGVPAIGGAVVGDFLDVWQAGALSQHPWNLYLWGAIIAGITGLATLRVLEYVIRRSMLQWFIGYLIFVGFVTLLIA